MCELNIEGNYIAERIKTVYNTDTKITNEYLDNIEYEITKISNNQYLTRQTNLNSGTVVNLMFFKSDLTIGYLSSSDNGIDNLFYNKNSELIHNWSIPIDEKNNLTNAHAILKKINK